MASKPITKQSTMSSLNMDQVDPLELEEIIQINQTKNIKDWKAKRKSKSLGEVAWEQMFDSENLKLPDTKFMNYLK